MEVAELSRMVARSLIAEIGPWGQQCVPFGGLVPGLLVQDPRTPTEHVGTRDVDLAIHIAAIGDEDDMYGTSRARKTTILDEFVEATGVNRKTAMALLKSPPLLAPRAQVRAEEIVRRGRFGDSR